MTIVYFVLTPFHFVFVQRGLLEIGLLSIGAGLLGPWLVLRGLAFYAHAVGTAAFPGLVLADGLGFSPSLGAALGAAGFAGGVDLLGRSRRPSYDTETALVLVGALALGVILASDVFHSGTNVETLLFGSLLLIGTRELVLAAIVSLLALAGTIGLGRFWLVRGFDPLAASSLGSRSTLPDGALLGLVAFAAIAGLVALGALLVSALLVVPAATTRLWTRRLLSWQLATIGLVAAEGVVGLWLSVELNVPPGAAIALLAGGVFGIAALGRRYGSPRTLGLAAASVGAVLVLTGCGVATGGRPGTVDVVATTTQIADWTRVVGGPAVSVHQILQANTDPHEYEPRPADVEHTAGAQVVFENGDNLDHWMGKVVSEAGGHPKVVDLGAAVPLKLPGESSGPEASRFDPHWWHDPVDAEAAVSKIRDVFVAEDPKAKAGFERRAAAYVAGLQRLRQRTRSCFATVPPSERKLVTDHDAFAYFARRYGITIVGAVIPSQTTQAQPSAGETAKLIELVRREHVKAVFPERSVNARLAETVARETGASAHYSLYGDTLGPHGSTGATYLRMEAANANELVRGFTGGARGCTTATP
jgi:ABC-type Zn uptake system ZnuABC Zn-binding protein ZnuA/ABC-type Mn2+/Zn2+ transport system permease subunit